MQTRIKPATWLLVSSAVALSAALLGARRLALRTTLSTLAQSRGVVMLSGPMLAQEEGAGDDNEVAPELVEKYIAVYKAMQRNHSLTIDQATAQQGLTVDKFRAIEAKVERDDIIRERVRQALRAAAKPSPTPAEKPGR